jgi:1,4-alpha-glucan branching enzyme
MATQTVQFNFITGLKRRLFSNARVRGSWDSNGKYSNAWTESLMQEITGEDGCPVFTASVSFDVSEPGKTFQWGVVLDGPQGANFWGIPTEVQDINSVDRLRQFVLAPASGTPQKEQYYFTYCRYLGANRYTKAGETTPQLCFAVWAPNAQAVEVIFGKPESGYINDDGTTGVDTSKAAIALSSNGSEVWEGLAPDKFDDYFSQPYMYRIRNAQGVTVVRTDIYSRSQAGKGEINPNNTSTPWPGTADTLDGTVSCSLVIDPDVIRRNFDSTPAGSTPDLIPAEEFWASEFTSGLPVPSSLQDLVIYELHVNSLGFGKTDPGDLSDAMKFIDHLVALGVNAVELMPMAEFSGGAGWGYGDTHHFCIESIAGGRDKYRHFVRECHRRGLAVIQDVVYNHFDNNAERAEYQYDSTAPEDDIYYWYEGKSTDYKRPDGSPFPDGGYIDNGSTGRAPRYWQEFVRKQFISSAAFLIEEMHVDGLRVDLTQAIHRDNQLHFDGRSVGSANIFGQKFLREWSRTLQMIRPSVMLIAEDHTGWDAVTKTPAQGGLGFTARWEATFYHSLIGASDMAGGNARLLKQAGYGDDRPLEMDQFSAVLYDSRNSQVVYHESHDEAGNAGGTARTMEVAVNNAAIFGATRTAAEARCRVCFGLSLLSAGTPMFFMGEEIGAQKIYKYNTFLANREDILGESTGDGRFLFRFYQDLITLSRRFRSVRSPNIDILHQSNTDRVLAFKRWYANEQMIVLASLNNHPFDHGYSISKDITGIPNGLWKEIFNSDSAFYGGQNTGNYSTAISSDNGTLNSIIPASGFVVLMKQ